MKFSEFKKILETVTAGDKRLPENSALLLLSNEAVKTVAKLAEPLTLMSNDISDNILTHSKACSEYFIRKPREISDDESTLDIDEDLNFAVAYQVAFLFGVKKSDYIGNRNLCINEYFWLKYHTLKDFDDD